LDLQSGLALSALIATALFCWSLVGEKRLARRASPVVLAVIFALTFPVS